jgi:hypothetical protein
LLTVFLLAAPDLDAATAPVCDTPILPQKGQVCGEPASAAWRVTRVGVELIGGALLAAPAVISGAVLGTTIDHAAGHEASAGLAAFTALGAALGSAPGVWVAGYLMRGNGSFWWTLAGSTLGTAISAVLLAIKNDVAMLAVSAVLPVAGAVIGYELSSSGLRPAPASRSVAVVPTFGLTSVGLSGAF